VPDRARIARQRSRAKATTPASSAAPKTSRLVEADLDEQVAAAPHEPEQDEQGQSVRVECDGTAVTGG
jgi:hypothetical protein